MTSNKSTVDANTAAKEKFDTISRSAGVIDLGKAAEYAYTKFYNVGKPTKTSVKTKKVAKKKK